MAGAGTSLIASGAGATVTTALGIAEYLEGKKMLKKANELERQTQRPTYEIPLSVQAYMSTAQKMALSGLPERERQIYLDQINRNAANSLSANAGRNLGLQGVAAANATLNDANANLLSMDSQQHLANIDKLQQARLAYGAYEDQAFEYNKNQPYQLNAAAVRALKGAGEQAKYAGAQTVANAGSNFAGQAGTALQTVDFTGNKDTQQNQTATVGGQNASHYYGYGDNPPTQQQWEQQNPYYYNVPTNIAPTPNNPYYYNVPTNIAPTPNNPYYYNTGTVDPNENFKG